MLNRLCDPKSVLYLEDSDDDFVVNIQAAIRHAADACQEIAGGDSEVSTHRQHAIAQLLEAAAEVAYHAAIWRLCNYKPDVWPSKSEHDPRQVVGQGTVLTHQLAINSLPLIQSRLTIARLACGNTEY